VAVSVIYLLLGPKGSGKSFVGNLIEEKLGIKFIRVEDWAKAVRRGRSVSDNAYIEEVFQTIETGVRAAAIQYPNIVFESTGITPFFDRMLDNLRGNHNVITIRIFAAAQLCVSRVKTRDQSIYINVSDEEINEINRQVVAKNLVTDFQVDNNNKTTEELLTELRTIIKTS
jgi:shikimate kinase